MRKLSLKTLSFGVVFALLLSFIAASAFGMPKINTAKAAGVEIEDKGDRLHWIDASVQLPNDYTSIVGFTLTVKLVEDYTDSLDYGYGGIGDNGLKFPCMMLVVAKGAGTNKEYYVGSGDDKGTFWCPEDENYEKYVDNNLLKREIVKFGVGEGHYVASTLQNGMGAGGAVKGVPKKLTYSGRGALFTEGNPIMTTYGYTGLFEIVSVEWETGTPIAIEEEEWDYVETTTYADIETVENSENNGYNYIDITIPKNGNGPFPVVLWLHGGAWTMNTRKDVILSETKEYALANGYAWASAEYTLGELVKEEGKADGAINPTQGKQMVYDLKMAIRFLRANASTYKLDTRFIAAMGESAGAHLSLLLGTTNGSEEHEAADVATMDWKDYSSDIQASVAFSLPADLTGDSYETIKSSEKYKDVEYYWGDDANNEAIWMSRDETVKLSCYMMANLLLGSEYMVDNFDLTTLEWKSDEAYDKAVYLSPYHQVDVNSAPMYLIHGEKDGGVHACHAYAMEEEAKVYMNAEDVKTAYWPDAAHVEKFFFDSYAQYTSTIAFLNEKAESYIGNNNGGGLPGWAIALIVVGGVVVVAGAAVAVVFVLRKKKAGSKA